MGLTDDDMVSGDIFKTKYVTWNNFDLPKQDADCAAYELLANITNQLDIHKGTMFSYIQSQKGSASYDENLENLQYDLLYGKRYAYKGTDKYPASNLVMGIDDVTINSVWKSDDNKLCIYGSGFTPWTKIYVNGEKVSTSFLGSTMLKINLDDIEDGDTIVANIVGSSSTIFRSSNEFLYEDPDIEDTEEPTTETEQPSTDTEGSTQTTEKSTEQSSEQSLSGAGTATDQSVEHTVNTPLTQN